MTALAMELAGKVPGFLYHYTKAASLEAILTSGVMRAYNLGKMNDLVEARYAASVMRAHIERGFAVEEDPNASDLLGELRRQLVGVDLSDTFALSFSPDGDELGMWKLYSDRGRGFSFAVPILTALSWLSHHGMLLRCNYDHHVLSDFLYPRAR